MVRYTEPELADAVQIEADLADSDVVQQEDMELCKRVQVGLASSGYSVGRYSPTFEGDRPL